MLLTFVEQFPGTSVYRGEQTPRQWLAGSTGGIPHRAAAMEEMMLLWMANRNLAFRPFEELFEDSYLGGEDRLSPGCRAISRLFRHPPADSHRRRRAGQSL